MWKWFLIEYLAYHWEEEKTNGFWYAHINNYFFSLFTNQDFEGPAGPHRAQTYGERKRVVLPTPIFDHRSKMEQMTECYIIVLSLLYNCGKRGKKGGGSKIDLRSWWLNTIWSVIYQSIDKKQTSKNNKPFLSNMFRRKKNNQSSIWPPPCPTTLKYPSSVGNTRG